jgi:hypothetical protein
MCRQAGAQTCALSSSLSVGRERDSPLLGTRTRVLARVAADRLRALCDWSRSRQLLLSPSKRSSVWNRPHCSSKPSRQTK